jgi:Holliday junction resolvase RusA-like endonuclease
MWKLEYHGILTGQPRSLGRPRGTKTGRIYTAPRDREYQEGHLDALGECPMIIEGPIRVQIIFVSKRPQRLSSKKFSDSRIWKPTKPDLDNMIKMILDILTKWGIWIDDNQVVSIQAEDYYCGKHEEPHTVFQLYTPEE